MENHMEKSVSNVNINLPTQVTVWNKIRRFLFTDINLELTSKQEKVLEEVYDFWNQDVSAEDIKEVLFYEITFDKIKKALFKNKNQ